MAVSAPTPLHAGFDPETGRVVLDGAALGLGLDGPGALAGVEPNAVLDGQFQDTTLAEADFEVDPGAVIEGTGALRLSPRIGGVVFGFEKLAETTRGRRVEIRLWYRPLGTYPVADLVYLERGGRDRLLSRESLIAPTGVVRLLPTGRATDDGWVELSTGPVDFTLAGAIEARFLRIIDARIWELTNARTTALSGESLVDGIEVLDLGEARFDPSQTCRRGLEAGACGGGACFLGRCVDPKPVLGSVPSDPDLLADYLEAQIRRFQTYAGGRIPQRNLSRFEERLRPLVDAREDTIRFWSTYRRAHDDIADGHLSEPRWSVGVGGGRAACIHVGEIDLLPGGRRPGYIVYSIDPNHPIGQRLFPGDALVAIDGLPPDAWAEISDRDLRYGGDPRGRAFIVAPQIIDAALRAGSLLRFERCGSPDGTPCTPGSVETIEIDLAALAEPFLEGTRPLWWQSGIECDFRFTPTVEEGGSNRVVSRDAGGVRYISIDGVIGFGRWAREARDATTNLPSRVILDQRTGTGGTFVGVTALAAPFLAPTEEPVAQIFPWLVPSLTPAIQRSFRRCFVSADRQCGNYFEEPLQGASQPPSRVPNARLAILNGNDVSGNDYLPRVLRARSSGATRIFGAVPTYGAFGPIFSLPRIMGEIFGGSVQVQDTVFLAGASDENTTFSTGSGVEPDEVVLQRQSDAVQQRDTLVEAAKAWVLGGDR